MFSWFRQLFANTREVSAQNPYQLVDALNAIGGGGTPSTVHETLGTLQLRSAELRFGDPMDAITFGVPNIDVGEAIFRATLWRYPSGRSTVKSLQIELGDANGPLTRRELGFIGVDSAKIVVIDRADYDEHWTYDGADRIGVISTAPDDTVLRMLTKQFKLKTVRVNPIRAEIIKPVSETLEQDILEYLNSIPKYCKYPSMSFNVETNNSFDRANFMQGAWEFMPAGNVSSPLMFVCATGRGDGRYSLIGEYEHEIPRKLQIQFIEDGETNEVEL